MRRRAGGKRERERRVGEEKKRGDRKIGKRVCEKEGRS